MVTKKENEIVLYQPNETIRLEVRVYEESVWLTQAQMAVLFGTTTQNITLHIRNIYKECELQQFSTCKDFLQVREEGGRTMHRNQKFNKNSRIYILPFMSQNNNYYSSFNS